MKIIPVLLLCVVFLNTATGAPSYTIQFLGAPGSYNYGNAGGLNELGQVAFTSAFPYGVPPLVSSPDENDYFDGAKSQNLPTLGGLQSQLFDMNNQGTAVGYSESTERIAEPRGDTLPVDYAVAYHDLQIEKLPVPGGFPSYARAINDNGQIVGTVMTLAKRFTFLLDPDKGYIDLGTFGGETAEAVGINNSRQVLINSQLGSPSLQYGDYIYNGARTLIYKDGEVTFIPDSPNQLTFGSAINEHGVVAGWFHSVPGRETHAFVWDSESGMTDISGGEYTAATDVNNLGTVVGYRTISYPFVKEAFVYSKSNGMQRLIDLIPPDSGWYSLDTAMAVNDRGQILGIGNYAGQIWQLFLLTPVPEPSSALIIMLAIMPLSCRWRDHRRASLSWTSGLVCNRSASS